MSRHSEHKKAREVLTEIVDSPEQYYVIHYSCESLEDKKDGHSPRITSIAIRNFDNSQTHSFSIHMIAEKNGISYSEIESNYDDLEKKMLVSCFDFLEKHQNFKFLHWNMRDINYGFQALEHRYEVLTKAVPFQLPDERKIDVSRLFVDAYGDRYIDDPRLESILSKNNAIPRDFIKGENEPQAFTKKEYIKLHQSTLSKVGAIADLVNKAADNSLKTNSNWRDIYGFSINGILEFLRSKWWGQLILCFLSIVFGIFIGKLFGV